MSRPISNTVLALIFDFTVTMKNNTCFLWLIFLIPSIISSSDGYGNKKFSQSFSSSSASSHASAYSSSSSYSYGGGQTPGQLPIIAAIPKANAIATVSASAGAATATANAAASAQANIGHDAFGHNHGAGNLVVPSLVGTASQFGGGSYSIGGSHSTSASNGYTSIGSVSYPGSHGSHNTIGSGSQVKDGSYSTRGYHSATSANGDGSSGSNSYSTGKDNKVISNTIGTGSQSASGTYSVGSSKASTDGASGAFPYNQGAYHPIAPGSHVQDGSYSAGGHSSVKAVKDNVGVSQYSHIHGKDNHVAPNKIGFGSQSGSGSYSTGGGQTTLSDSDRTILGGALYPYKQGSYNSIGAGGNVQDGSYSTGGHNTVKIQSVNIGGGPYSYSNDEDNQAAPNKVGANSPSGSGSYSAGGSKSTATSNSQTFGAVGPYPYNQGSNVIGGAGSQSGSGSYSTGGGKFTGTGSTGTIIGGGPHTHTQGAYNTVGTGSQFKGSSHSTGSTNSVTTGNVEGGSNYYNKVTSNQGTGNQYDDGSYSSAGSNADASIGAGSYSYDKSNQGSHNTGGSGIVGQEGAYSSAGNSYGSTGSKSSTSVSGSEQKDYSSDKKYLQPAGFETPTYSQPALYPKDVRPKDKPFKNVFPGPNGSIYDYKVPSQQNYGHTSHSNSAHSGSYSGSQSISSSGNNVHTKPCCKGPFPGPFGSIHNSKPASAVGTSVKTSITHPPLTRVTPKTPIANFPGPSGSIYTSKPVIANVDNDRQNSDKWASSGSTGTYQKQYYGSHSSPLPSCTQQSCTNAPKASQQKPPISYLEPPVVKDKPVVETAKEGHKPNINTYIPPDAPTNTVPQKSDTIISVDTYKQKMSSPISDKVPDNTKTNSEGNIKPTGETSFINVPEKTSDSVSGFNIPKSDSNLNIDFSGTKSHSLTSPSGSTSTQVHTHLGPVQIPTSHTDDSYYSDGKSKFQNSFLEVPTSVVDHKKQNAGDRDVNLSNTNTVVGYTGTQVKYQTEREKSSHSSGNVEINGGLKEGHRGSPFETTIHQKPVESGKINSGSLIPEKIPIVTGNDGAGAVKTETKIPQLNAGSYSVAGATSGFGDSKITISSSGKDIAKPVDISSTIGKKISVVSTNGDRGTIVKQVPNIYTSTLYIDLNKPSPVVGSDAIIFNEPESFSPNGIKKSTVSFIGSGSHGLDAQPVIYSSAVGSSSSNSYGSSSSGFGSTSAHRCNIPGCGSSYRHYSNAVPSPGVKTAIIHIGTIPSSGISVGTDKYLSVGGSYAGSYGSKATGSGYGASQASQSGSNSFSSSGSYGGTFPQKSHGVDDGAGGFLSSIYSDGGSGAAARAGSHAKAGSYSSSSSFSKANSYASSSSFSSSSSGAYSSHHY